MSEERRPTTTADSGVPAGSDERSLTVGPQGPTVLHDHCVVQKMQHLNRERVPVEDIVDHASAEVTAETQDRVVAYWTAVDREIGNRVASGLERAEQAPTPPEAEVPSSV